MTRHPWKSTLLMMAALLLIGLHTAHAQEETPRSGLRPDAPEYALHGPFWVGHQPLTTPVGADAPLAVDLWYPALNPTGGAEEIAYQPPGGGPLVVTGNALAGAPIDPSAGPYPLVVLSHGFALGATWYHTLAEHYASHGFIVLAPAHADGQEWLESAPASIRRPRDITRTLDLAEELAAPSGSFAGQFDLENVAVVGHSYGGYTALAAGGARLDTRAFAERCAALPDDDPGTFLCLPVLGEGATMAEQAGLAGEPEGLWPSFGDARVRAIVPIAGDAYLFGEAGLASVTLPVMAIGGTADTGTPFDWGSRPTFEHAASARKALVAFEGAEHMFVGAPCESMPWIAETPFYAFICFDPVWDKLRALDLVHHLSTAFLLAELKGDAEAAAALAPNAVLFPGIAYEAVGY